MFRVFGLSLALVGAVGLGGCTSTEVLVAHAVDLEAAQERIPEEQLLDVGVSVFDPGVPEGEVDKDVLEELIAEGTFVQIRRTEALYLAVELQETLRESGHWGGVWVVPEASTAADVNVHARILHSDGDVVELQARAVDATGRVWFDEDYELETAAGAFNNQRYPELDPYQDLFHMIANDLADARAELTAEQRRDVRTVAELRYAGELSPEAFDGYVAERRNGTYEAVRLPAVDDPMFARTQRVRQRERLFFDTLNQHYESFANEAESSYDGWREYSREESIAIRELTRSSRWRTGMGVATIVASVLYGSNSSGSFSDRVVRDALMYVGVDMLRTSAVRRQEKRLHSEALDELSASFDEEVEPLVVDIEGTEHRLTGTAETQYREWRRLLRETFIDETGMSPEELEVYREPGAQPVAEPSPQERAPAADNDGASAREAAAGDNGGAAGGA